jgi:hypothetical protein
MDTKKKQISSPELRRSSTISSFIAGRPFKKGDTILRDVVQLRNAGQLEKPPVSTSQLTRLNSSGKLAAAAR